MIFKGVGDKVNALSEERGDGIEASGENKLIFYTVNESSRGC